MTKVLLLGATGYIGRQIANLLVQSGQHTVYGVTRTPAKAKQLAKEEIIPIICPDPVNQPDPYLDIVRSKHIDVVVDVAGADAGSYRFLADAILVGKERMDASKAQSVQASKLGYIYCSGSWVHGSSNNPVNDLDIVGDGANTPPEELVAWRVGMEQAVLQATDVLDVMILRPALIYGRESTIWAPYFIPVLEAAKKGFRTVEIPLVAHSRPGLIHVDDTAKAFVRAIAKVHNFHGTGVYPIFDLVTSQESMRDIFTALASIWGFTGTMELKGHGGDLFSKAMSASFRGSSARAKQLLDWQPTRLNGFVQDMDIYAAAFVAEHIE
jgi:nucleoside-diphosphate-sugar epimerase